MFCIYIYKMIDTNLDIPGKKGTNVVDVEDTRHKVRCSNKGVEYRCLGRGLLGVCGDLLRGIGIKRGCSVPFWSSRHVPYSIESYAFMSRYAWQEPEDLYCQALLGERMTALNVWAAVEVFTGSDYRFQRL